MKHRTMISIQLLTLAFIGAIAVAMGGNFEKGDTLDSRLADWPKGLETALTSQSHEGGCWVNPNTVYWFRGDAHSLNRFLKVSAKIEGAPVYIRFHSGKGEGKGIMDKPAIPIDWQVSSFCRNWSEEVPKDSPTEYLVRIDVWDGGQVTRSDVVIPKGIVEQVETESMQPTSRPASATEP